MQKIILGMVLLFCFGQWVHAQQNTGTNTGQIQKSGLADWQAIKDFHGVMSQTFHPSEEGNLEPIKARIGEMVEKAKLLETSEIPQDIDTPELRKEIKNLINGSEALQKLIAEKGGDDAVVQSLESLHDVFHNIIGLCVDEH